MSQYTPPFYLHGFTDQAGVVAANNFLSVFNPANSTKALVFFQAEIRTYSVGISEAAASMNAFRISAASGGSLISAANVNRFNTASPNPVAEVRVGNPTVTTVGTVLNGFTPPIAPTGAAFGAATATSTPPGAGFICAPGEGIVFTTASGDVDQRWNITTIWAEVQ